MGTVSTALKSEAESIFTELGYTVTGDGSELCARRKWRVVRVTPTPEPESEPEHPPSEEPLRCFVTWEEGVTALERRLARADLDYEWAIIGVGDDDYVVSRRPS